MAYRDDLIEHLKQEGYWDKLPVDSRKTIEGFTDEQAREYMVRVDEFDMGDPNTWEPLAAQTLTRMILAFRNSLITLDNNSTPTLTEAGQKLSQFFISIKNAGLNDDEIAKGLEELDPLLIAMLIMTYRKLHES